MLKFHSIRSRLTVTFLAIILAVMLIISIFLYNMLERYNLNSMEEGLTGSAFLVANFISGHLREQVDEVRLSSLAEGFSRQARARVLILNSQGIIVGDSRRVGGDLGQTLDREEVRTAFEGEVGSSIRFSERTQQDVMQVAVPVIDEGGEPVGVIFLSASLDDFGIHAFQEGLRRFLYTATLIAMVLVGGGSVILARRLTGPLEVVTAAAEQMADGKLEQQIKVQSRDEIGDLAKQFNIMAARLNFYTGKLRDFAANVSHELRTPLASLSILTKSLKEYSMDPEQRQEFLDDLDRELGRLIRLVSDLLELTRLEKEEMRHEQLALDELLRDIAGQASPRFTRQGLRFIHDIPSRAVKITGSALQLRQAVHNLLDNALKYTDPGGQVTLSLWFEGDHVGVKVEDTGAGIPEKDLTNIFERFYRVDRARSREMGGTGLGLAIVKETIIAHGGKVWAESKEGSGSAFYFTLPLESPLIKDN